MNVTTFTVKELKERLEDGELDLSLSTLTEHDLPLKEMKQLKKIQALDLSCNVMTCLPAELCSFTQLVKLDLSKNLLTHLPDNIGQLKNLQNLDLLGNRLSTLPESFGDLTALRWLDVRDNQLSAAIRKDAGDCLDDKQCKTCALKVVALMNYVHTGREKLRTEERAKQDAETQRLADEEREEKKRQKQMEKERRRLEFFNQREDVLSSTKLPPKSTQVGDVQDVQDVQKSSSENSGSAGSTCSAVLSSLITLLMAVVLVAGILITAYYYCESFPSRSALQPTVCKSFLAISWREYIKEHIIPLFKIIQDKVGLLLGN